jgi:hypothetical protein
MMQAPSFTIIAWLGEHPLLRALFGHIDLVWVLGLAAKVMASRWLTAVVVSDLMVSMLHQGRESERSLADTALGEALARKLDVLGCSLRGGETRKGSPG